MRAALISLGSVSSQWTLESMRAYFDEVEHISLKDLEISISGNSAEILYKGKAIEEYDCVYAKGSHRFSQVLRSLSTIIHNTCYLPIASEAFTVSHDKLLTQLMLQSHNIPMPKTYISTTIDSARELLSRMNYPIIMKFPQGTQGKGVMFADSFSSASSILDALSALKQSFIIQEFIETGNSDIRAFVIGNEVIAAMARKGNPDEARSNIHAGGVGESVTLDAKTKEIAVKAAKATGADICGVDILMSAKGPMVIETNISPGLQGITKATGINISDKIAKFLYNKTTEFLSKSKEQGKQDVMAEINSSGTIIISPQFKGNRIVLPELATRISKIKSDDQINLEMHEGQIKVTRFDIG